jgi:hypothetical protein
VLPLVSFRMKNFWDVDIGQFDVISIFGVTPTMQHFGSKIIKEGKQDVYVICFRFPIHKMSSYWTEGELFIYNKNSKLKHPDNRE